MSNIADIRGGKPNSISDRENGTELENKDLENKNLNGEEITDPDDPNFKKPLHPDEQKFLEEERLAKEEAKRLQDEEDEKKKNTPPVAPAPAIDYKEKFSQSSREAQVLSAKLKETEALLGILTTENLPSEEEIAKTVPNYEYMTDNEKYLVKRQLAIENETRRTKLTDERKRLQDEYAGQINAMVASDPRLKGKEAEFKDFISKPSRQGVDGETLLSAFLFEAGNSITPSNPTPPARPGLSRGTGGGNLNPTELNKSGYTDEQIAHMRKYDQKKYLELVRTRKI